MNSEQFAYCVNYAKLLRLDQMGFTSLSDSANYIKYIVHYHFYSNGKVYADIINLKLALDDSVDIPSILISATGQIPQRISSVQYPNFIDRYALMLKLLIHIGLETAKPLEREHKIDCLLQPNQ